MVGSFSAYAASAHQGRKDDEAGAFGRQKATIVDVVPVERHQCPPELTSQPIVLTIACAAANRRAQHEQDVPAERRACSTTPLGMFASAYRVIDNPRYVRISSDEECPRYHRCRSISAGSSVTGFDVAAFA
jgi:hypothetical protein